MIASVSLSTEDRRRNAQKVIYNEKAKYEIVDDFIISYDISNKCVIMVLVDESSNRQK